MTFAIQQPGEHSQAKHQHREHGAYGENAFLRVGCVLRELNAVVTAFYRFQVHFQTRSFPQKRTVKLWVSAG